MTLERFILLTNTKIRLKEAAIKMGFENVNNVLFRRESDGANIKFDDEEVDVWYDNMPRRRTSQYYNMIRTEVDKGFYTEELYLKYALENLKEGRW